MGGKKQCSLWNAQVKSIDKIVSTIKQDVNNRTHSVLPSNIGETDHRWYRDLFCMGI